jgi:hypothetical protein
MNVNRILSDFLDALGSTRVALRSPTVLLPFVVFGVIQMIVVWALASFPNRALAPVLVPLMHTLGGEEALHYPQHFILLPDIFHRVYIPLVAVVGFSLWTLAVWWIVDRHEVGRRLPAPPFVRRLPDAILVGVVFTAVSVALGRAVAMGVSRMPPGIVATVATIGGMLVIACAQALLVFAPVVLRIRGVHALEAIRVGVRYAARVFGSTLLIVFIVLLVHAPLDYLIGDARNVAMHFRPETVFYLQLLSIALEIFTAYLLFSTVVGLALPEEGGLR